MLLDIIDMLFSHAAVLPVHIKGELYYPLSLSITNYLFQANLQECSQ